MKMILALIWLALTVACTGAEVKEQPADELILRTYQVPSGMAESVKNIMNNNFHLRTDNDNIKQYAKVSVLPNGQLAVLASHNIHNGFSKLVKDLTAENLPQPENLTLELWAVAGIMDGEPDDANIPSALAPALDSLRNQGAAKRFLLLEKLQLTGALGNSSTTQGAVISIRKAELNKANNRYILGLNLSSWLSGGDINTQLYADDGKLVVVAQNGLTMDKRKTDNPVIAKLKNVEQSMALFYILRVTSN